MRILTLVAVLLLLMPGPLAAAAASPPAVPELTGAVVAALPGDEPAEVTVLREDAGGWAFGTAVRRVPAGADAYPEGWLWLSRRGRVALAGTPGFGELSRQAPVLAPGEQEALAELSAPRAEAATDYRTGMRLPYQVGAAWRYTGGPHPMSGATRSSIDLAGGDGRVRAVRNGRAYTMCSGWVRVVHDRGFATDYYHLHDHISADGRAVQAGKVLGRIGTDVTCGGSATGPHVHFSLRRHGDYVAIDRYLLGKWSIRAGARAYEGYARHGSARVNVGGSLHNYGALGFRQGVVDTDGGGTLNRRAGPGTGHEVVGTIADGETVTIRCSDRGTTHTGRGGYTTEMWNRLAGGGWVSDAFVWTGTGDPVNGWCQDRH